MAFIQFLAFIQFTKCRRIYSHINNIKPYPTLIFCSRMLTWRECTRYLTVLLATRDTFCALHSKALLGSKVQIFMFWTWKIFFSWEFWIEIGLKSSENFATSRPHCDTGHIFVTLWCHSRIVNLDSTQKCQSLNSIHWISNIDTSNIRIL